MAAVSQARRPWTVVVSLLPLLLTAIAIAQPAPDDGPLVISPELDLEPIYFYGVDTALELEWRRNDDSVERSDGSEERGTQDRLREIFELRTEGFIGHPNLVEFDIGGRVWLEQNWLDFTGSPNTFINQILYEWDVNAFLIQETRLPVTLYTRQNVSDIDRQFGGSLENTFRETGARINFVDDVLPTSVQLFRRRIEQQDNDLGRDFNIDQDTVQADGRIVFGQAHRIAWDAKYDDIDQSGDLRVPQSFNRFEANATHMLSFGLEEQSTFRTQFRFFDETGFRDLRQIRVEPRLRLWHSEDLISWYDYSYGQDDLEDQEQWFHRGSANVQYQLFDSLTTIGNVGVDFFGIPTEDFNSNEVYGRVDLQYLKEVPLGLLAVNFDGSVSYIDQSERGASVQISDDLRVFGPANLIVIDQRNVSESSIVITDVTGIIIYTSGFDYSTVSFPDRVEIRRLAGGDIAPGQAVLIDYTIGPEPGGNTDTTGLGVDVRYTFEEGPLVGLSVYGQYFRQDQRRTIVLEDFPEDEFTDVRYGVDYNFWKLYVNAEQLRRDGTLSSFNVTRVEGRYTEPLGRGSNLVLSALYQDIDREDSSRTQTTTFSGQWRQQIGEDLRLALILQYQLTDDDLGFDSNAFEQQFDITWRKGQTEVYAQIRTSINDTNTDDTTFQRFIVGLRREF